MSNSEVVNTVSHKVTDKLSNMETMRVSYIHRHKTTKSSRCFRQKFSLTNPRLQRKLRFQHWRSKRKHRKRRSDKHAVVEEMAKNCASYSVPGIDFSAWKFMLRRESRGRSMHIEPRVITFQCEDPDEEIHTSLRLHNRAKSALIYKIKITNPYLFRVQPSMGVIQPRKRTKVRVSLLEGVNVDRERVLVLFSEIPMGADGEKPLCSEELRLMWRDPTISEKAYQHRLNCQITGRYRKKSKILFIPDAEIISKPDREESMLEADLQQYEREMEGWINRDAEPTSSIDNEKDVCCKTNDDLNMNSNSQLPEWLLNVPTQQQPMVEEIYHELEGVNETTRKIKPRIRQVEEQIEQVKKESSNYMKEQSHLKHEVKKVKIRAEKLEQKTKLPEIIPEDLQDQFMREIEFLMRDVDNLVGEHELLWKLLENHEIKLKDYNKYLKINSNQPTQNGPKKQVQHNKSTNAKFNHKMGDSRSGFQDGTKDKLKELEKTQDELRERLADTADKISTLAQRSGNMADMLKEFSAQLKTQKKDRLADIDKLEMKYTEECALMSMRELTKHNQDMISNLHSSFLAHIENLSRSLNKLTIEHKAMRHFLESQRANFKRLKKAVCDVGKGIHNEHQHILEVVSLDSRRFNDLTLIQATMHDRMKDIHIGLRNSMEKTQALAKGVGDFERKLADHKMEMRNRLVKVKKKSVSKMNLKIEGLEEKFSEMTSKLDNVWEEIKVVRDFTAKTERMVHNLATKQRQHKDAMTRQVSTVEQRAGSQIEGALQEARRHYDALKAKIAGFQGTLKGVDGLLKSTNEKLQTLYNELDRFKTHLTEEMKVLVNDIAGIAERHLESIVETHKAIKKRIDEVLKGLTDVQKEAKVASVRLTELEEDLEKHQKSIVTEIENESREAQTNSQVRAQKSEVFHSQTDDDITKLNNDIQGLMTTVKELSLQMDQLENKTSENVEEMRAMYDELTKKVGNLTTVILQEFYSKMQKGSEQLQDKLESLSIHINSHVDKRLQQLARLRSNAVKDQLVKVYLKAENSNRLAEAASLRVDRNFYLLIIVLILLPLFMYSAFMNRNTHGPVQQVTSWWQTCCGQYLRSKQV